ncbi:MAG: ATP-dependent helicase HrpB [Rhodobacteraceae bacterium]|nr:ATP-dependent helicase HrpB [Paracoccaceae bacterium]
MPRHSGSQPLPIDAVIDDLLATLVDDSNAVLVAEPGAGKTTRVPLALLDAPWCSPEHASGQSGGRILVLEPRRLAARSAARRMASELGEAVGETVGYRVRMDTKVSAKTRIEVITEGVFTRLVLDDPELSGVSAVLFDEFHERSLDGDLGLALALDVQSAFREDLRLLPMSATIEATRVSALLGDCRVLTCEGRSFPVETRYLGRNAQQRIEPQMAAAILKASREESGSILAFLPGQGEIKRSQDLLRDQLPADTLIAPLYGAMDGNAQDMAINPAPAGQRKVVLTTAIAQTSLTIEGIRVVIDSGLARVPRYEPQTNLTRLETVRVSQASADQRRGRAGRLAAGVCYRLWDEPQTSSLPAFDTPEILQADLSSLALDLATWGSLDLSEFAFLDAPPKGAWSEAISLLQSLNALDDNKRLTDHGKQLSKFPLSPRLAHMVMESSNDGEGATASYIASILSDPGLGGRDLDLRDRIRHLERDRSARSRDGRAQAHRWLDITKDKNKTPNPDSAGRVLALAYPDRVAEARGPQGRFRLANGRSAEMPAESALASADFLVIADLQGKAANGFIKLCAPISKSDIEDLFANAITEDVDIALDGGGRLKGRKIRRYGAIELASEPVAKLNPSDIENALLAEVKRRGIDRLGWSKGQLLLRARVEYARHNGSPDFPDLSDDGLLAHLDEWLRPFLSGMTRMDDVDAECLGNALAVLLPYPQAQQLDQLAPSHFTAPTGTNVAIDYSDPAGPSASIRVQELFGLSSHPAICQGSVPLTLKLLSPASRPLQITRDLPGFWAGSWADVKAEMKGRYPKHPWPDDPATADPTNRVKRKPPKA